MNLRTWGLVSDSIVMVQAFAELRYGVVVHVRESSVKIWAQFNLALYGYPSAGVFSAFKRDMPHPTLENSDYGTVREE